MKTNEMNMNEMEQVNGGFIDKYDVAMFLMKLLLPDPTIPPVKRKQVDEDEDPMAPVILPRDPLFPRNPVGVRFRQTTQEILNDRSTADGR